MAQAISLDAALGFNPQRRIAKLSYKWTSDASGDVSLALVDHGGGALGNLHGILRRVTFAPDGDDTPSDLYDVVLNDADGVDVLSGRGANQSDTTAATIVPGLEQHDGTTAAVGPVAIAGPLTLVVSNAGNAKVGYVHLYLEQ